MSVWREDRRVLRFWGNAHKLNLFQQIMALWEEVHPYNAVYVIRLRGPADVTLLRFAIQTACHQAGVGTLVLDRKQARYRYDPFESITLQEIASGDSTLDTLCLTITEELNSPFPEEPHHPVRWKVLKDPKTESHFLLATFRHLVADEASMRLLTSRVLRRYCGAGPPGEEKPLEVHPPHCTRVLRHHYRHLGYFGSFFRAVRLYLKLRSVHRIPEARRTGERLRFCLFEAPDGLVGRLAASCRTQGVTVTEAFLAALSAAMAGITPDRLRQRRRRGLAFATAADLRGVASEDLSACFGLYLGQSVTVLEEPELADFGRLLSRVVEAMRVEKTEKRFAGPRWDFMILTLLWRCFSFTGTRAWYRKVYPLSACLSSVRIDTSGFAGAGDHILDFIGAGATGPAFPLLLVPYTLRDRLNLGITYCESVFTHPQVCKLVEIFLTRLESLAGQGGTGEGSLSGRAEGQGLG